MSTTKLILVIGATGAQGLAVIDALLGPVTNGKASPYSVRALTRDPAGQRALELSARGVECVKGGFHFLIVVVYFANPSAGSFEDQEAVSKALEGVYGVWVNTDGFTVGEIREIVRLVHLLQPFCSRGFRISMPACSSLKLRSAPNR
jgi:hypothetical protein